MTTAKATMTTSGFMWAIPDTLVITWRNLLRFVRLPQLLVFSTIQPVMLLLLFNYVFGGAITTGGVKYIQYLLPGFLVQIVIFGSTQTSVGLAEDLSRGLIDRFRSLPMARAAVLAGRTVADNIAVHFSGAAYDWCWLCYRLQVPKWSRRWHCCPIVGRPVWLHLHLDFSLHWHDREGRGDSSSCWLCLGFPYRLRQFHVCPR